MRKINPDKIAVVACMVVMTVLSIAFTIRFNGDKYTEIEVEEPQEIENEIMVEAGEDDIFEEETAPNVNNTPKASTKETESENILHININTSDINELKKLDGIGDKMAQRIINYRILHGDYKTIHDIKKVAGIGKKRFESIKNYIYVE